MAYSVTKTINFCYGHRLMDYAGRCKYLHGHNGRLEVRLENSTLNRLGMVADFTEIKAKIKTWVDHELDHRFLICRKDPLYPKLKALDSAVRGVDFNPTAENIAKMIFEEVRKMGFPVREVRLWETDTSCASYSR